ncbi:MAG: substrate-binding domain-containing protein [Desulfovibrionaceae bacterium]
MKRFTLLTILLFVLGLAASLPVMAEELMMATTTSTDNTGLLDYLAPEFTKDTGIDLKWSAMGTGKALQFGKDCNCDVLLVHAPASEKKYVEEGFGVDRKQLMYNDFVIIGPAADPAGVKGKTVVDALTAIGSKKAVFVSRGDDSGTNKKEISLWKNSGLAVPEQESWYVQSGQGMLATINMAAEKNGYTMTDRGTFITYEHDNGGNPPLVILVEGDSVLFNQYSALAVNPQKCPAAKYDLAKQFIDWMASDRAQQLIGDYKLLGKQLFTPNAE